ncbi:MAG: AraC family transcriptional regulator [Azonexus sp.]
MDPRDGDSGEGDVKVLRSSDIDETRQLVAEVFCDHGLKQIRADERLNYHHELIGGPAVEFSIMNYGARVSVEPGALGSFYLVQIPLDGIDLVQADNKEAVSQKGCATVHSPNHHLRMCWSANCKKLVVRVDKNALEQQAVNLTGRALRGTLEFDLQMDTGSGQGGCWGRLATNFFEEIRRTPSILRTPVIAVQFEQLLMTSLLEWQPNNHLTDYISQQEISFPRYVRRVEEYMEANCHLPITLDSLVAISGVSGRSLFASFQKFKGVTPMNHLRNIRMSRVRRELESSAAGESVTEIATRWGFYELGRFAGAYKKRYGEYPSETLKRNS